MDTYERLVDGYRDFREKYLSKEHEAYRSWASKGQAPKVLIIGCSDSRVNPSILTHAGLGEVFVVNNVANIVPPYVKGGHRHMSTGSAIQHAVKSLGVEHIIVMGHSGCGGIAALMAKEDAAVSKPADDDYITDWVSILEPAKKAALEACAKSPTEDRHRQCEMEGILLSVQNLAGYPWVQKAVRDKTLTLHAWYFHIDTGELLSFRPDEGHFRRLIS